MLTSKQRAKLRGIASTQEDVVIIGKEGLTNPVITSIREVINARELIKIKVLQMCEITPREIADKLEEFLNADVVGVVGSKVILYKKSDKKGIKHIEL